mmetsp:Transcript_26895/g.46716  ORF Transcript_26895/g.46716 Transcript_26895/m.46716 type:complete len:280 (-) Transcript_26895:62-901(-)
MACVKFLLAALAYGRVVSTLSDVSEDEVGEHLHSGVSVHQSHLDAPATIAAFSGRVERRTPVMRRELHRRGAAANLQEEQLEPLSNTQRAVPSHGAHSAFAQVEIEEESRKAVSKNLVVARAESMKIDIHDHSAAEGGLPEDALAQIRDQTHSDFSTADFKAAGNLTLTVKNTDVWTKGSTQLNYLKAIQEAIADEAAVTSDKVTIESMREIASKPGTLGLAVGYSIAVPTADASNILDNLCAGVDHMRMVTRIKDLLAYSKIEDDINVTALAAERRPA